MKRSRITLPATLAATALGGAVAAVAIRGGSPAPAAVAPPPSSTATVVRTNLTTTVLTGGTLGYVPARPIINRVAGTYTWLPSAGREIGAGHTLYRVDDRPVVLMTGTVPAWRPFALGMTSGPDIRQLQANLIAEGYATGLLAAPDGNFGLLTADAVEHWQTAYGYPATGQIPLGQVIFLPSPVLVGALSAAVGQDASPGQAPYAATTIQRTVTVPLNPNLPPVAVGEAVSIVLPTNSATPGTVTAVGPVTAAPGSATLAAAELTVTPDRPGATGTGAGVSVQVSLVVQSVQGVLAVPVSALLALAGGGYGLEVVSPSGAHHLVGVIAGAFAGGRVQVGGPGIGPGTTVVTAP
ncbi:MAG TPA: peptidoglycan-binding domain-containing protein [Streptosporangiaceae bacterium]